MSKKNKRKKKRTEKPTLDIALPFILQTYILKCVIVYKYIIILYSI